MFEKAGYYSVWAMAFEVIGLDIMLLLVMVEREIAVEWDACYRPKRAAMRNGTESPRMEVTSPLDSKLPEEKDTGRSSIFSFARRRRSAALHIAVVPRRVPMPCNCRKL